MAKRHRFRRVIRKVQPAYRSTYHVPYRTLRSDSMRVYSEKEIQNLLRQAAALQAARRDPSNGLTLDEIRRIAEEAGIDAAFIDQAASGLTTATTGDNNTGSFWGGTYRVASEMTLNHTVDEDEWAIMVAEIRRSMGQRGQSEALGRGFDWRYAANGQEFAHVTLTPRGDRTHVDMSRVNQHAVWHMIPGIFGFFAGLMGFICASNSERRTVRRCRPARAVAAHRRHLPGARALFASATQKLERKNADLLERLALISADTEERRARTQAAEPSLPLLDSEALGDAPLDETRTADRTRRRA